MCISMCVCVCLSLKGQHFMLLLLQLKVVCHLNHEEIKPLFRVCKDLRNTVRDS